MRTDYNTTDKNKRRPFLQRHHWVAIFVLLVFSSGLFSRCANVQGAPEGGPKDTIPPRVVRMTPTYNSTNLWPKRIVIDFDEYVQLKKQQEFFFTSPFMEVKPSLSTKNKSVIIDIESPLDSLTTYVLDLGESVVDNNEGNAMKALNYTFSTGPVIDSMFMSGLVEDALTGDSIANAYVFFYDAALDFNPEADSLLFDTWRASAVAKTKSDGGFIFPHLKPIDYRVYIMMDNNSNQMYDPGSDEVAFLDSIYNPASLPSFFMWYDSVRQHVVAEPQLFFRSFKEEPERLQNLAAFNRLADQQLMLKFSAAHPNIREFNLRGIDPDKIELEIPTENRDSLIYWLNIPEQELPDTLWGDIVYERHDSARMLYWHEQELRFIWKKEVRKDEGEGEQEEEADVKKKERKGWFSWLCCKKKKQRREQEAEEKRLAEMLLNEEGIPVDSLGNPLDTIPPPPPSLMKFNFSRESPVIPGENPLMSFDLLVSDFDTEAVQLFRLEKQEQKKPSTGGRGRAALEGYNEEQEQEPAKEMPVDIRVVRDSMLIRQYAFESDWEDGGKYRLFIPPGTIHTIDGEKNDSINLSWQVAADKEMSTLTLNLLNAHDDYEYILQIMDKGGKQIIKEIPHLKGGTHEIHYIKPGEVSMRMIEDRNGNGKWDTGILTKRVQPELVRWFYGADGKGGVELKANVEFEVDVDLANVFKPRVHTGEIDAELTLEPDEENPVDVLGQEIEAILSESERPDKRSSEARVEDYELIDLKADKKNQKAVKREERAKAKAEQKAEKAELRAEKEKEREELRMRQDQIRKGITPVN